MNQEAEIIYFSFTRTLSVLEELRRWKIFPKWNLGIRDLSFLKLVLLPLNICFFSTFSSLHISFCVIVKNLRMWKFFINHLVSNYQITSSFNFMFLVMHLWKINLISSCCLEIINIDIDKIHNWNVLDWQTN